MNKYYPIIGLETHVELKTQSKMFCTCSADYFGQTPNSHTCPVCLGMPGGLPVPNKTAIEWCIKIALALNCEINLFSKFDRKNYFYPDLAKGYQISQYDLPFGKNGSIRLSSGTEIGITRVHMEEDTGKLIHEEVNGKKVSLIDFNRSGVPLVEIVTEPDFHSSEDVVEYLQKLQQIVRYLDVSNADMEKGNMRLEPNISLQKESDKENKINEILENVSEREKKILEARYFAKDNNFSIGAVAKMFAVSEERILQIEERVKKQLQHVLPPYKVEVKNINSFGFVKKAIEYELKRQAEILDNNEIPAQETRGWNEKYNRTDSQRSKEEAHDYRYFPEPDIPPITFSEVKIAELKAQIPELPDAKIVRFEKEYGLPYYDCEILTRTRELADYFEEAVHAGNEAKISPKQIANAIINKKVDTQKVLPAELIKALYQVSQTADVDEGRLTEIIAKVIADNPKAIADYKSGKENVIMFLVGQVIKEYKAKIDAQLIKEKIIQKI